MGRRKRWGDSFARWYYAQRKGVQFMLCLALVSAIVLGLVLIVPRPEQLVEVQCNSDGSWAVWVRADDPRLKSIGLDPTFGGICSFAFDH